MAWIDAKTEFNPDAMDQAIIGIASELVRHDSGEHMHQKGQFLFAQKGSMRVMMNRQLYVVPPQRLLWIPANMPHRVFFTEVVGYRSIYLDARESIRLPDHPMIWVATSLMRAVLETIASAPWDTDWQLPSRGYHWLLVLWDELVSAKREHMYLDYPEDYRLQKYDLLAQAPPLSELALHVGASERTITRIFQKETGMNYQSWRQQWRLLKAIELLSEHQPMMEIALSLGFGSYSAFSTFFKNMMGISPKKYL
ncbi:hypothetical protein B9T11_00105 [Wohlfahrtiimonas chitiniclastica]|uniref:AraC family transcriptional regulator n=1 Tax=Wohlfahrtiimonas chitiniclastica TaxID=400946 RepID=UPI000B980DB5|nr:helix-turn-helix transcriptional regulator [Wohlfahrtiimonas chitiniclastica]OYQ82565.1 hypothetical protein B9T11_00105 [Wohlfahrtiimonas chitiniclastica]